jgi:predicted MFS family arabinose efflux permease
MNPSLTRPDVSTAQVLAAQRATYVAFIGSGFGFASWASRIPQVRDSLHASPSTLGLVLLAVALGSLIALPLAGVVVTRLGTARTISIMAACLAVGLTVVALGYTTGILPVVIGLFLIGFGNGTWDVAMNVEGAAVEQHLGKAVMPRFHAGFSIGTVAGALGGAAMVALHVPVTAHLIAAALVVGVTVPLWTRRFLPPVPAPKASDDTHADAPRHPLQAWLEPRTLLIGVFVLCMAFTEGTGNDWLAVAVIDGYGTAPVAGPLTFAVFLAAMTVGRWFGPNVLDRFGRVATVRASALLALVGLLLVVFGAVLPLAVVGSVLWGLGTALGFPVGMSAAADDPRRSAARVSVVASVGYTAFLAGPPLIGFLGDHVGVLKALTVTAALLGLAALIAGTTAPLAPETARPSPTEGDEGRRLR